MANIDTYLQAIMNARYGKDVRQSIHDGIEAINDDTIARNAENKAIAENAEDLATQAKGEASTAVNSAQAYANQALAHEQQAQAYRDEAEQFKDEAFSGTPQGYDEIVAKVNSIYRATATSFAEVGTKEGSALAHTIYGMSMQDGTPTPTSPVEIQSAKADFRCTGKNLIPYPFYDGASKTSNGITYTVNDDGSITANGTATGESLFVLRQGSASLKSTTNIKVHTNKKLVLSGCPSGGSPNNYMIQIALTNGTNMWANSWGDRGEGKTFSFIPSVGYYNISLIRISIASGVTVNNLTFRPMLTLADADQTYEPYQHTDVTTDLTLRAIEVASTDEYTYERDGKYYIADTIDWSEDRGYEITRRVKEITINSGDVTAPSNPRYGTVLRTAFNPNEFSVRQVVKNNLLLSSFVSSTYENFVSESGNGLAFFDGTNLRLRHDSMTSTADWSTYLQSNPVKVTGILITPTTEPIASEQAQALLSLKTYDEASYISSTGSVEPSVDLEYAKSEMGAKALTGHNLGFKNALKLNDINTALLEMGGN
jgi:hypothetical protein